MYRDLAEIKNGTKKMTILYVEDEEMVRNQIASLLEFMFANVIIACNGKEGFELYSTNADSIDIILTDIQMPLLDGIEMSKQIKEVDPMVYIIALSAHQNFQVYQNAIDAGMDGFIIKPITAENLLRPIIRAIKRVEFYQKKECMEDTDAYRSQKEGMVTADELTSSGNKVKLDSYLYSKKYLTAILVNMDNFDRINSLYGYDVGDEVLKMAAEFLLELKSESAEFFRIVSDEFVYLFDKEVSKEDIEEFVMELVSRFQKHVIETNVAKFTLSCTIGIARGSSKDVLKKAHIAMKETRQIGKEKFAFFSNNSELSQKREKNIQWKNKLTKALREDSFIPYFQPIYNNKTSRIEKYEVLARIIDINRVVKPYYFLESAKLFSLLPNICEVMIEKAFEYFSGREYDICINITQQELKEAFFAAYVKEKAEKYSINTERVVFEIAETANLGEELESFENLKELKRCGFKIAIDDFGTESLNCIRLHELEIDYIKIDGIIIKNLLKDDKNIDIVRSVVSLCHNLKAKSIAEFVYKKEIQKVIKELDIDYSQGYYIGRPSEDI